MTNLASDLGDLDWILWDEELNGIRTLVVDESERKDLIHGSLSSILDVLVCKVVRDLG